jgi:hypothetical protein
VGNSLHDVFLVAAPIAFAGFLVVTLLREQPLRGRGSGQATSSEPRQSAPQQERMAA